MGRGLARRIARQEREAAFLIAGDPALQVDLDRLHRLRRLGAITAPEASARLTALIREQHAARQSRASPRQPSPSRSVPERPAGQ